MSDFPLSRRWTLELICGNARRLLQPFKRVIPSQDPACYFRKIGFILYDKKHIAGNDYLFSNICLRLLEPVIKVTEARRVLDLGCGDGSFLVRLPLNGMDVTLVDCCPERLKVANDRLSSKAKSVLMINDDIRQWKPGDNARHDVILSINVIPYINDLDGFLNLCRSLIAPNGYLLIAGPVASRVWEAEFDGVRVLFHTRTEVNRLAQGIGFKIAGHAPVGFRLPLWPSPIIIGFATLFKL